MSIDGLAPYVLAGTRAPTLARLAREGTSYTNAITVLPSITLTSHASMLSGVPPERHQVLWNYYDEHRKIQTPTIFTPCKRQGLRCVIFAGKDKFLHFAEVEPGVSRYEFQVGAENVLTRATSYIRDERPDLVFIHLAEVDSAGHQHGWNSPQQREAIEAVDARLAQLGAALAESPRPVAWIITSDHGGHGFSHGGATPEDRQIPWIAWGDGVMSLGVTANGRTVSTMDTAATVLALLGLPVPPELEGKPLALATPPKGAAR